MTRDDLMRAIVRRQAQQDQEVEAGKAWLAASSPRLVKSFWDKIQAQDCDQMNSDEKKVVCALAAIGMFEIIKATLEQNRQGAAQQ